MARLWLGAREIDARTPAGRNRYADALRLLAIAVVVYGHWLISVVTIEDGRLDGVSLLAVEPATQLLTWVFQVMPLFFFVGGYANAAAYLAAVRRGVGWADWVRGRARRLLRPAVPLVALWVPLGGALAAIGVPRDLVQFATTLVVVPVWFLAAYLVVCTLVPITHGWHRRRPLGALLTLVGLALVVDLAHQAGVPLVGWSNFLWVWGAIHQAGYLWHDADRAASGATDAPRLLPSTPTGALTLALAGYAALLALTTLAGYPASMVGVDEATRSNNSPPSVALLALAAGQVGLSLAARGPAERLLARPRVWATVVVAGSSVMTVFLWHMTAMVVIAAALVPLGVWPDTVRIDATWWLLRLPWLAACTVVLVGLLALFRGFEVSGPPRTRPSVVRATLGVALATGGLGLLVFGGLHRPGTVTGVPWVPLGATVVGLGALGALRAPRRPERLPAPGGAAEPAEIVPPESSQATTAEP